MNTGPRQLSLFATVGAPDLSAAVRLVLQACRAVPALPEPVGWRIGDDTTKTEFKTPETLPPETHAVDIVYPTEEDWGMVRRRDDDATLYTLRLDYWTDERPELVVPTLLHAITELCRVLLREGELKRAALFRLAGGHCLPEVPLVYPAAHLVVTPEQSVGESYANPSAFFSAWDKTETWGDLRLCVRALDAPDNPGFLRHVLMRHMAMARAARPGLVRFSHPRFERDEFEVMDEGDPTLTGVGYFAERQLYEFAGHTPPGTELRAIDLFNAWRVSATGELKGVGKVREVRAVFMDQEQARRAAPLLHAAGVVPTWDDGTGTLRQLNVDDDR